MAGPPPIVVILADQWRADTLVPTLTPNLCRLQSSSVTFSTCVTNGALCRPARISWMTGQPVSVHGFSTNRLIPDPNRVPSHVRDLRQAGYRTVLVGKSHLTPGHGHLDDHRGVLDDWGFDTSIDLQDAQQIHVRSAYTDWLTATTGAAQTDKALRRRDYLVHADWTQPCDMDPWNLDAEDHLDAFCARTAVAQIHAHGGTAPLYLQVSFPGPHPPFDAPTDYRDRIDPDDVALPQTISVTGDGPPLPSRQVPQAFEPDALRALRHAYFAKVALVDEAIGRVLDALADVGLLDDAWLIVTSDHGELLGDHGLTSKVVPYEGALRVPLLIRPPMGSSPRTVTESVDLVDVADTVRAIAQVGDHRGLVDAVATGLHRERPIVSEAMDLVTVRTPDLKGVWDRDGRPVGAFDLVADPLEQHNRVAELADTPRFEGLRSSV